MGGSKSTETVTLPPASGGEGSIIEMLRKLGLGNIGQLGDLSKLASGDISALSPTGADRALVAENMGFTGDIARRQMEETLSQLSGGLDENLAERGVSGASFEAVDKALLRRGVGNDIASMMDRSRIEGNTALMQLPGQRAGIQLGANQELFNRIIGSLGPALAGYQNPRMASQTRTTTTKPGALDYLNTGLGVASMFTPKK